MSMVAAVWEGLAAVASAETRLAEKAVGRWAMGLAWLVLGSLLLLAGLLALLAGVQAWLRTVANPAAAVFATGAAALVLGLATAWAARSWLRK